MIAAGAQRVNILYEDDALLFVNKSPDIIVARSRDPIEATLFDLAAAHAGKIFLMQRLDRGTMALLKRELLAGRAPVTHGGVVGQVWRGGAGRQANVARLLAGTTVIALDDALGRRAGVLLGRARRKDVIDAAVVLVAMDGDWIVTSDPDDLRPLAAAAGVHVELVSV